MTPEDIKRYQQEYFQNNKEKIYAKRAKWRKNNKDKIDQWNKNGYRKWYNRIRNDPELWEARLNKVKENKRRRKNGASPEATE